MSADEHLKKGIVLDEAVEFATIIQDRFGIAPVVFPLEFLLKVRHRRVLKEKAD